MRDNNIAKKTDTVKVKKLELQNLVPTRIKQSPNSPSTKIKLLNTHNHIYSQTDQTNRVSSKICTTRPPNTYNQLKYHPVDNTNSTILSKQNKIIHTLSESKNNNQYITSTVPLYQHQPHFQIPTKINPIHELSRKI